MSAPPQITITGPYNNGYEVEAENEEDAAIDLYLVENARDNTETDPQAESIVGGDADDTFLAGFAGSREQSYEGNLSGHRLWMEDFGETPREAFVNYIFELESLVLPEQGVGYKLEDRFRDRAYTPSESSPGVLVDEVEWTYEAGNGFQGDYRVSTTVTEGVQRPLLREDYIEDQQNVSIPSELNIGGFDTPQDILGVMETGATVQFTEVEERRYSRSIDVEESEMIHNTDVPVVGVMDSGVEGEYYIDGRITYHKEDIQDAVNTVLDATQGRTVGFIDGLTNRTFVGIASEVNTIAEAGKPGEIGAQITITVGDNIATID